MAEWAWPVKLPQAHQFDHRFRGWLEAMGRKIQQKPPWTTKEPRRPHSKGDLDVGRWSGLKIFGGLVALCFWIPGSFRNAIGIYTPCATRGLISLSGLCHTELKKSKPRNFRSTSPTEPALFQRNLENWISQLLWQLLWHSGSWLTFFFFRGVSGSDTVAPLHLFVFGGSKIRWK